MVLEGRDIIQIDATVIAGALILFTLTSAFESGVLYETSFIEFGIRQFSASAVAIFSLSAIAIAVKPTSFKVLALGRGLMIGGFVYLILVMGLIANQSP